MADIDDVMDKLDDLEEKIDNLVDICSATTYEHRMCPHCSGTGTKTDPISGPASCPDCGGDGLILKGKLLKTEY